MRLLGGLVGLCLLAGCATPTVERPSVSNEWVDPLVEFRSRLPTLPPEELDRPENQMKVADCIIAAIASERPQLLRYLCDPDATEYLLNKATDLDPHLASHLIADLMDDAKTRIALSSTCRSTRIVAALAVRDTALRRRIILHSKDAAIRNAYAETLDPSEVELLTLLASDPDKAIATRAADRLRK